MKKDKLWAKIKVQEELDSWRNIEGGIDRDGVKYILNIIDELDEREVLSQEEIDSGMVHVRNLGETFEVIPVESLPVPKQELPVIPKNVADWIEEERGTMSNWKQPSRFISDSKYKKDQRRYKWSQVEGNMDKFMSALINSYEVEEVPKYHALIKGHELVHDYDIYWNYDKSNHDVFVSRLHPPLDNFTTEMSKEAWKELGINETNADFVEVEELKE